MAMREGRFSKQHDGPLAEGTVRSAISNVSTSFRENGRVNPTRKEDGELGRVLTRLFRAFRNKDPNPKQQKALPAQVLLLVLVDRIGTVPSMGHHTGAIIHAIVGNVV